MNKEKFNKLPIKFCAHCKGNIWERSKNQFYCKKYDKCFRTTFGTTFNYIYHPIKNEVVHFYYPGFKGNTYYSILIDHNGFKLRDESLCTNDVKVIYHSPEFKAPVNNYLEFVEDFTEKILKIKIFL